MSCGRCDKRGRALRRAVIAAAAGDGTAARRDVANAARSLTADAKAFARALRTKLVWKP